MPLKNDDGRVQKYLTDLQLLVTANHILHYHGLVDAFGHISIRHPLDPDSYIIAAYDPGAPALVSSVSEAFHSWSLARDLICAIGF